MKDFNDIGISRQLRLPRIRKLLSIGLFASVLYVAGDMILGWGVEDESLTGIAGIHGDSRRRHFCRGAVGNVRNGAGGTFALRYLLDDRTAPYSPKYAHSYRAGIFGYLMFGACGFHVPTCALVFLTKHGLADETVLRYITFKGTVNLVGSNSYFTYCVFEHSFDIKGNHITVSYCTVRLTRTTTTAAS